jgi:TPR repeat protein
MPEQGQPRRWSAGYIILVSTMVGIFALVFGVLVISIKPELIQPIYSTDFHSLSDLGPPEGHTAVLEFFRQGDLDRTRMALEECKESDTVCIYHRKELEFFESQFDLSLLKASVPHSPNPDLQYLYAIMVSNRFDNFTEYTSDTFPLSVLYMYAASTAGHAGALMAMGYRHMHGYGVPKRCETAALNYLEVAKPVANIYANSIPKAVELVRLGVEKDKKLLTLPEISLFTEVANTNPEISLAVGKRFLLGTDGFPQDYAQAFRFLSMAARTGAPAVASSAWALLGYIHALGLGVDANVAKAEEYFELGIEDGLGMNGLGYLRFKADRFNEAFNLFNQSAAAGSSDGMFNLASMFLTGTGTNQNFQKAFMWFTEALRRGHTPAGYALAVMHLNGIGTIRDCGVAVSLLKEVAERGDYVAQTLRAAHAFLGNAQTKELGVLQLLKLAEAGHQVSQENLAHLIDSGKAGERVFPSLDENPRWVQTYAQRFYELAADQGSVTSQLRLGDYAYYGWGLKAEFSHDPQTPGVAGIVHAPNEPDFPAARKQYVKARDEAAKVASLTGGGLAWVNKVVGTASFNLGYMHHFGIGTRKNLFEASRQYRRAISKETHGAWILERIIDWFVYPSDETASSPTVVPEGTPDVTEEEEANPSVLTKAVRKIKHSFKDYRIIVLFVLFWVLSGLLLLQRHLVP